MAKCTVNFPDELCAELTTLAARTDEVIFSAREAGGEVALDAVRGKLKNSIGKGESSQSTGELQAALGLTKPRVARNGICNIKVGFDEPRSYQNPPKRKRSYNERTNAMIANVLEYGKHNQPPRPFLKPAKAACRERVISAMREVFDKELKA